MSTAAADARAVGDVDVARGRGARRDWRASSYAFTAIGMLVVLLIVAAILGPKLFTLDGLTLAFAVAAPLVLAAMALTPVAISGQGAIDLSVGPFMSFVTVVLLTEVMARGGTSVPEVIGAALLIGIVCGAAHGAAVAFLRLQPIVVALGLFLIYSGLSLEILGQPGGTVPGWLADLAGRTGPIPNAAIVIAAACVAWWIVSRTTFWRNVRVTGGNEVAAYASGVRVAEARIGAYVLGGILGGMAGLMLMALLASADPTQGANYTLTAIAALALGGTSLAGGRGGMLGSVVGAFDIYLVNYIIGTFDFGEISGFVTQFAYGAILVSALVLGVITTRSAQRLRQREG